MCLFVVFMFFILETHFVVLAIKFIVVKFEICISVKYAAVVGKELVAIGQC